MKKILKSIGYTAFAFFALAPFMAKADSDFNIWKKNFYQEAIKSGISQSLLNDIVPKMTLLERVIQLDTEKPEYVINFYDHIQHRVTDQRIQKGKTMAKTYKTWLSKIEEKYKIPSAYLLALWGMETNYGTYMGNVNIRDSLATLAYHPRRRKYFTKELIAYLKILDKESSVAPTQGSWDGGFGHFQFMPTTFLAYAVDEDNNGRRDIVHNIPDSFGSTANYMRHLNWNSAEPWGREVVLPTECNCEEILEKKERPVMEWAYLGISPKRLENFPEAEFKTVAELYLPMGISGPAYLIYPNFKLITKWNALWLNAIATCLLADAIADIDDLPQKPTDFRPLKTSELICLQHKLKERGFYKGGMDGKLGTKTRLALQEYQRKNGFVPDGYPNQSLIIKMECQHD